MNLTKAPFFMLPLVNIFNHPLPPIWPQRRKHLNAIINMRTHTNRQYNTMLLATSIAEAEANICRRRCRCEKLYSPSTSMP